MGYFTKVVMDGDRLYRTSFIFQEPNLENIKTISCLFSAENTWPTYAGQ